MKSTTNVFQEGLRTDLHPLSTSQKVLTDALNATMITYNGNEMMLQNDMGNTLIQDSKTGHIMGLSEGFIPVGLKEHGGIMYIASVNKEGKGEIGTIPSPILTLSLKNVEFEDEDINLATNYGPIQNIVTITEFKVYPGEKFLPLLNINTNLTVGEFYVQTIDGPQNLYDGRDLVSAAGKHDGLYKLKLYSIYDNNQVELSKVSSNVINPIDKDGGKLENKYWFISSDTFDHIDIQKTYLDKQFQTYPGNIPPGKLGIKAELETIDYFGLIKITQMEGSRQHDTLAPLIVEDVDTHTYQLWFPGFEYKTESIRFIRKIDVEVHELYSGNIVYKNIFDQDLATVYKETSVYQIQPITEIYKIIEPQENLIKSADNYFVPLFKVDNIKNLDTWYQITVKYYDQFGGYINTYQFSFNPLHIRNFTESYYNIEWNASQALEQKWLVTSSPSHKLAFECKTYGSNPIDGSIGYSSGSIEGTGNQWDGYYHEFTIPINSTAQGNFTVEYTPKIACPDYSYLWGSVFTTNMILTPINISVALDYSITSQAEKDLNAYVYGQTLSPSDFYTSIQVNQEEWDSSKHLDFTSGTGTVNDHHVTYKCNNISGQIPITTSNVSYNISNQTVVSNIELSGQIGNTEKEITDIAIESGGFSIQYNTDDTRIESDSFTFPSPDYSIIPSFTILGDTDEEMNIPLGLTRTGRLTKAWTFEDNIYDLNKLISKNSSSDLSTFSKDTSYFPASTTVDTVIIDKGVYLINVDHNIQQNIPKCYFEIGGKKYNLIQFSTDDGHTWIAPTLIYIPFRCQFQMGWENLDRLQNIGMYRVLEDVLTTDGGMFGDGDTVQVKYYQSDEFIEDSEMILQLEATYFEDAKCLGKEFRYYPGLSDCSHCNKHVLINDATKTSDTNNMFTVSKYQSFIYKYDASNPLQTVIPQIEGLKGNTLTYRIKNNGEN